MVLYVVRRLLWLIPVLLAVSLLTFALMHMVPGGPTNTNFFTSKTPEERAALIQPEVMAPPAVWLASDASAGWNGRRLIACRWDEALPLEERLARAGAPAAWPQLGRQAVLPTA